MSALLKEQVEWLKLMHVADESPARCCAYIAVCEAFDNTYGGRAATAKRLKKAAKDRYRELLAEQYGSILLIFILVTIAGAALSWAVERLLDHIFPQNQPDERRISALRKQQQIWQGAVQ